MMDLPKVSRNRGLYSELMNGFKNQFAALAVTCFAIIMASAILEVMGRRIIEPDAAIGDIMDTAFLFGTLRTAAGALFAGFLVLAAGLIPGPVRRWSAAHPFQLIAAGSGFFILAIIALVAWAPASS